MRARVVVGALAVLALRARAAAADEAASNRALAEALFQAGKTAMKEGRYDEACAKLTESERLEPGGGTLLLLGMCHESQGKYASAHAELKSALAMARRDRRADREKLAARELAQVESKVPRIIIRRPTGGGVRLALDGTLLTADAAGTALPVDPGAHHLEASAPGKLAATVSFGIAPGEEKRIEAPTLVDAPAKATLDGAAPLPLSARSVGNGGRSRRRTLGWTGIAVGAVGLGVGTYFGIDALQTNAEAKRACDPSRCSDRGALDANDRARTFATVSTIGIAVGAVLVAAGLVLLATSPSSPSSRPPSSAIRF